MKKLYAKILIFLIIQPFLAQEKITFDSANPFNFRDVIVHLDKQESQEVFGILNLPETSPKNKKDYFTSNAFLHRLVLIINNKVKKIDINISLMTS